MSDNEKASQKWSGLLARRAAPGREGWFYAIDSPHLRRRIHDAHMRGLDPFSWLRSELSWGHPRETKPIGRALEIGCGAGDLAMGLMQAGWFERLDAFDVAEGAVATARQRAADAGLTALNFFVADGNTLVLEPDSYDLIYASHALHHITDLEHLFAQCAAALRPGGTLFATDYVGPSRMQYSDAHLALMNDMLARLPPEKRVDNLKGFREKRLVERTPPQAFLDNDPSEAPRSAEIIPVLRRFFDVEATPYGMELTYEVLLGIVHNFDPDNAGDNALMDLMLELDHAARQGGQASTLFANIVARPRDPAASVAALLSGTVPDFAALLSSRPAPPVSPGTVAGIDGWLGPEAADLTIRLCRLQAALGLRTGVLELGVYRGKYLALLAALHGGAGLPLVGVDLFIERIGQGIPAEHVPYIVAGIVDSILGAAPDATPPLILHARTQDLDGPALLAHCPAGYSFISVDAGHEAEDVANDLALAGDALSPGGIVALDDALSLALPGVAERLFRYLSAGGTDKLAAFATCANKLFLCRPDMHATYLAYAAWLLTLEGQAEYLAKSSKRDGDNRELLFVPRLSGREIVAFEYGAVTP